MTRKSRKREMKKNIATVLIIALFAVAVFGINAIGRFIAEKVIQPIASLGKSDVVASGSGKIITNGISLYGAGTENISNSAAKAIKENGGGAYELEYGSLHILLYGIYGDKSVAEEAARLIGGNVYNFDIEKISVRVTGTGEQIEAVENAFKLFADSTAALKDICGGIYSSAMSKIACVSRLKALAAEFEKEADTLLLLNSDNETVARLTDMCGYASTLFELTPSLDDSAFNEKATYVATAYICEYLRFCDSF